jgi:hypothetical protein
MKFFGGKPEVKIHLRKKYEVLRTKTRSQDSSQKIQLLIRGLYEMGFKEIAWVRKGVVD